MLKHQQGGASEGEHEGGNSGCREKGKQYMMPVCVFTLEFKW